MRAHKTCNREQRVLEPLSPMRSYEHVIFRDYEEKDGLDGPKHYKKIVAFRDGNQLQW